MYSYGRRKSGLNEASRTMFGSTGWLFADLMLAIAMAFLVANTVGAHTPQHKHRVIRTKQVCSPPALNRDHAVQVNLTVDDVGLLSHSRSAQASIGQQVRSHQALTGKSAGFVIIYAGNADTGTYAIMIDRHIKGVLIALGKKHYVFQNAVYLNEQLINGPPTQAQLEIYLFEPHTCRRIPRGTS